MSRQLRPLAPLALVGALLPLVPPTAAAAGAGPFPADAAGDTPRRRATPQQAADTVPARTDTVPAAADTARVTFDFQSADLRTVLTALAEASGTNIVYADLPDRSVTLRTAEPVPRTEVRALLESVVEANGLAMQKRAGVVRVYVPEDRPPARREGAGPPARDDTVAARRGGPPRLFVHRLAHADAAVVARTLRTLFGLGGGPGTAPRAAFGAGATGGALSERLQQQETAGYRSFAEPRGRRPGAGRRPAGGRAAARQTPPAGQEGRAAQQEDGQEEGQAGTELLLRGPVEIVPDTRTNSILVLASPADFETVKAAIEKLDRRPLQVLIEVLIVEIDRTDNLNVSTQAEVPPTGEAGDGGDGESGVGGSLSAMGNLALEVLGIGSVDASAVLNVLAQSSDATVLSRPVVMAQNNEEARILVGEQRPFVQVSRASEGGALDQVVQFQNVGTELRIRPTINRDGFVNLEVLQEVSNATQVTQFNAPVINTRESETDVLVRDGHTAVLGGLVDRETERTRSGVPLLKDIPVLGGLFGSTSRREVASELFILLTPHVLHDDADIERARRQIEKSSEMLENAMPDPVPLIRMDSVPVDSLPAPDTVPSPPAETPPEPDAVPAGDTVPSPDTAPPNDTFRDRDRGPAAATRPGRRGPTPPP